MKKIFLTNGQFTLVSDIDFLFLVGYNWHQENDNRVNCSSGCDGLNGQRMRRIIAKRAGIDCSNQIDHIDRNPLNNQRENLRPATHSQNCRNSEGYSKSGYKGVYPCGRGWQAQIQIESEKIYLGYFDTPEEASEAYNQAADYYFNEFANY